MRFLTAVALALLILWVPVDGVAQTDCPEGTRPGNLYSGPGGGMYAGPGGGMYAGPGGGMYMGPGGGLYMGPGGGLYTGPGGGLYAGPGGGLYAGPGSYCSNRPPLPVFLRYLEENGYEDEAALIRRALR